MKIKYFNLIEFYQKKGVKSSEPRGYIANKKAAPYDAAFLWSSTERSYSSVTRLIVLGAEYFILNFLFLREIEICIVTFLTVPL